MAHGACERCGNAYEDCDCPVETLEPVKRVVKKFVGNKEIESSREDFLKGFDNRFVSAILKSEELEGIPIESANSSQRKSIMARAMIIFLKNQK